jgi:hypothetical protein
VTRRDLQTAVDLIVEGSLTPLVDRTFDLVAAADAIRYLEQDTHAARS